MWGTKIISEQSFYKGNVWFKGLCAAADKTVEIKWAVTTIYKLPYNY